MPGRHTARQGLLHLTRSTRPRMLMFAAVSRELRQPKGKKRATFDVKQLFVARLMGLPADVVGGRLADHSRARRRPVAGDKSRTAWRGAGVKTGARRGRAARGVLTRASTRTDFPSPATGLGRRHVRLCRISGRASRPKAEPRRQRR